MTIIKSVDGGSPGQYLNIYSDQVNFNLLSFLLFQIQDGGPNYFCIWCTNHIHILQDSMSENELELDNLAQSCNENLKTSTFPWILILYLKHQIYKILIHSCLAGLSLELEFVPYQLSHCRFKSDKPHTNQKYPTQSHSTPLKAPQCYIHLRCLSFCTKNAQTLLIYTTFRLADETVWLLGGSDRRLHVYAEDKTRHMYTEVYFSHTHSYS